MPRPCCLRRIAFKPHADLFKPEGIPLHAFEQVTLTLDEVEALRLADLNGLYQERAAEEMRISRPTFSRIVEQARRKVADALIHGKALRLAGGTVTITGDMKMPARDGTGPRGPGPGMGLGPCSCRQRRGRLGRRGARFERCNETPGTIGYPPPIPPEPQGQSQPDKGEQNS